MIRDAYKFLDLEFEPSPDDVRTYLNVLDVDGDGIVTMNDVN